MFTNELIQCSLFPPTNLPARTRGGYGKLGHVVYLRAWPVVWEQAYRRRHGRALQVSRQNGRRETVLLYIYATPGCMALGATTGQTPTVTS